MDSDVWAMRKARFLRERCADELDFEHLADELESMGAREKRGAAKQTGSVDRARMIKIVWPNSRIEFNLLAGKS
ncbi:DUF29 family protein [Candidatus Electronema sp. JC]|uniref:DUF29 family protein n=1 Tax=Candidatus Electronema sp. JC TaxID=3401570 RepID=UPI003B4337BD